MLNKFQNIIKALKNRTNFKKNFKKEVKKEREKKDDLFIIPSRFWCAYIKGLKGKELEAFVRTKGKEIFRSESFYWTAVKQKEGTLLFLVPEERDGILEAYEGKYPLILHLPEGKYAIQTDENWLNIEIRRLENGDITIDGVVFEAPLENEGYIPKSREELLKLAQKPKYKLKWSLKDPCKILLWIKMSFVISLFFFVCSLCYYHLTLNKSEAFIRKTLSKIEKLQQQKKKLGQIKKRTEIKGNITQFLNLLTTIHQVTAPNWIKMFKITEEQIVIRVACVQPPCNITGFSCKELENIKEKRNVTKTIECKKQLTNKKTRK